ncbi:MAG TPA: L-threonylcarbamoyladenylate synthase [Urbifossiella sp.]|nr:L-threonylcarbamoyladenylate synthase [Urbifossiella sp.]
MTTDVLTLDPAHPDPSVIARAAVVIRAGGLVAFPTETVYGLGANALDPAAVGRIFAAKGRPATNPVIVHVADTADVLNVAAAWPATAAALADRFWPGPLTLVLPKRASVPDAVTASGQTVAVRCPDHAIARALIRSAGVPIAAPSANRSTELSPTLAEHVLKGLDGRIALVLDGGPCRGGIESTVVDVTGDRVQILRPGLVTAPMLEAVVGPLDLGRERGEGVARSPGQMARHYSPRTPVMLVEAAGKPLLRMGTQDILIGYDGALLPADPAGYASRLYARLHELDAAGYDRIIVELPPDTPEWAGVRDRLLRAAEKGE